MIEFFNAIGNKVFRKGMGEIALNNAGAHDSLAHGYGRLKAATFASLPDVLKEGKIISYDPNYLGRQYESYFIAAPVKVGDDTCYVGALVIKDNNTQRYKVHEALIINEDGTESFKTGDSQFENQTRDTAPSMDSIPASAEKSNHQIPELRSKFDGLMPGDRRAQEMKASAADRWEAGEGDFINAAIKYS